MEQWAKKLMESIPHEPGMLLLYIAALIVLAIELCKFIVYIWKR
jgi:hypothetical protein